MVEVGITQAISIHALRGEGDRRLVLRVGAGKNFNPRPPWGGRHVRDSAFGIPSAFQSTPSVGRATKLFQKYFDDKTKFQSTPSVGRATNCVRLKLNNIRISIHALRGEGDL